MLKSAWTGAQIPGQDNRTKMVSDPTPKPAASGLGTARPPAGSAMAGAATHGMGPGVGNVIPSLGSGTVAQQRFAGAGNAMRTQGLVQGQPAMMQSQAPQQAPQPPVNSMKIVNWSNTGANKSLGDVAAEQFGNASNTATEQTTDAWARFRNAKVGWAEQQAQDILGQPIGDPGMWDQQRNMAFDEIDKSYAMQMRQLQQQAGAMGGGMGGVQLTQMGALQQEAQNAKARAAADIALKQATMQLEDKKLVLSVLQGYSGLADQRTLALLNAKMGQQQAALEAYYNTHMIWMDQEKTGFNPEGNPRVSVSDLYNTVIPTQQ